MLQAWHRVGALTFAGYILGFPDRHAASIVRDIRIIQRELPIDLLEFFILTPLPGSQDHKELHRAGVPIEPRHEPLRLGARHRPPRAMTDDEWRAIYRQGLGPLLLAGARRDA